MNVIILASMDALDHGCIRDMDTKRQFSCSAAHQNTVNYRLKSVFTTQIPVKWAQTWCFEQENCLFSDQVYIQDMTMSQNPHFEHIDILLGHLRNRKKT